MRIPIHVIIFCALAFPLFLGGCMSQEARTARVENRQDRIDARTAGRQERWEMRAEREDARANARFNSW